MRTFCVVLVLALAGVAAANAQNVNTETQTVSQFIQELYSTTGTNSAWDKGFIMGVVDSDPKVCTPVGTSQGTQVGAVADDLAVVIAQDPSLDKPYTYAQEQNILRLVIEKLYPCAQ